MNISFFCVLIAAILPYVWVAYAKFSNIKNYNNTTPREFLDQLEGKSKRAHHAHLNSFEAFPAFASSIILAHLSRTNDVIIMQLSVFFVLFRIAYGFLYIFDKATLRSLAWFGGFICVISLFILAVIH